MAYLPANRCRFYPLSRPAYVLSLGKMKRAGHSFLQIPLLMGEGVAHSAGGEVRNIFREGVTWQA